MIIPFVSFLSPFCYLSLSSATKPLSLAHPLFLLTAGLLSPFSHLLSFFSSFSDTSLFSVPPSLSGISRRPHINATCNRVSFSDPPSHLTTLLLTSKRQEKKDG